MDNILPPPYAVDDPSSISSTQTFTEEAAINSAPKQASRPTHDRFHISGAAYFAMHPPASAYHGDVMHYNMVFWPGATPDEIPFPQPHRNMQERDVDSQDWAAFVSHLRANLDAAEGDQMEDMAPSQDKKRQDAASRDVASGRKSLDYDCLQEVMNEWNEGFFLPRGLKVLLTVQNGVSNDKVDDPWISVPLRSRVKDRKSLGKALHTAISRKDTALIQSLLKAGADVNARPLCGTPSLTCAVKQGDSALVQMLLEKGPDLEATAPAGPTALYEAVTRGESEQVALLLGSGANANAKPPGAEPALYRAASRGRLDLVKLLLDGGADVDGTPPGGTTAFYIAAEKDDLALMRLLLKGKANVEEKPPGGASALHRAVTSGNREVVKLLLENGADVDAAPPGGKSALNHAVSRGDHDLVRLLLDQST